MFGLGMIKGTIIGMGLGVMAGLAIKEVCKMKKKKNQISKTETDIVNPENS
jgi:F0F1-type ATP synthase assembly protein I|tara:strand:+ start:325 stop:477 length:153 start_codon:yes stop_codon:yes gene_type:complete